MKDNLFYLEISKNNPEKILDKFYMFDEKNPNLPEYVSNTKEIKNILITIRTLIEKQEKQEIIDKYFLELSNTLGKFSNCSEFGCFINACDSCLDYAREDFKLLKKITSLYFEKRNLNEIVPEEWIQAIIDTNSSRKKGKCGEDKLLTILSKNGFREVFFWDDFEKNSKCVARFSKTFSVKTAKNNLGIKMATKKQGKKLDLIIKNGKGIYICEAKHLNTGGGGQDKQISELIEVISLKEYKENVHYISFLDGVYSNFLLNNNKCGDKLTAQRKEIMKYLDKNKNNFWVNTAGFSALFQDIEI